MADCYQLMCMTYLRKKWHQDAKWEDSEAATGSVILGSMFYWEILGSGIYRDVTWFEEQEVDLASKFPRSQSDLVSVGSAGQTNPIHGCPTLQLTVHNIRQVLLLIDGFFQHTHSLLSAIESESLKHKHVLVQVTLTIVDIF